jgi:hypothetical protein
MKDDSSMKDSLYVEIKRFKAYTKDHASNYLLTKATDAYKIADFLSEVVDRLDDIEQRIEELERN